MIPAKTALLLEAEAARIHTPEFVKADPVQFPRRFTRPTDIEIVSILGAHLAWGNRKLICRDIERLLGHMQGQPTAWLREGAFEAITDDENIHRTFFGRNLKHFCRGLQRIYSKHPSLDAFCASCGAPATGAPAWHLAAAINQAMADANAGRTDPRCLPLNLRSSALKRLNMALRWLVRQDDGIVDLGIWHSLTPAQLFIPLDVHVGDTARALGLITRRANDRRSVTELTAQLRTLRPNDPTYFDFALFGIPVTK